MILLALAQRFGNERVGEHELGFSHVVDRQQNFRILVCRRIGAADTVRAGSLAADVIHTPGHTEGSICLYFPAEKKLIAGDTLFAGSIGRTDLPGGSMEKIISSLHEKVLALPDETVVVPGHGPLTTIGEERESNPFLQK